MDEKELEALNEVLNYLWDDEQKDFIANENPKFHIFNDLEILERFYILQTNKKTRNLEAKNA